MKQLFFYIFILTKPGNKCKDVCSTNEFCEKKVYEVNGHMFNDYACKIIPPIKTVIEKNVAPPKGLFKKVFKNVISKLHIVCCLKLIFKFKIVYTVLLKFIFPKISSETLF